MLSLQTLELCPYPCMPWNASRVRWKVIIFISFSKHKNSGLFFWKKKIWIATSYPFLTLEFSPILHNMANLVLFFFYIGVSTLSFRTLDFWNSDLSSETLKFRPYPSKHLLCGLILLKIIILAISFETLEFWFYPSKH